MDCPRCENDVDGTATFCAECGLNFEELRQDLGVTDDAPAPKAENAGPSTVNESPDDRPQHSKTAGARETTGDQQAAGASRSDARRQPPAQESDGLLTRRRLLVGGVGASGLGLWQTGNLEWLLGGGSGDWPVPSGIERVSLTEEQKNVVRSEIGSQDAEVRVYTTTEGDPMTYYRTDSLNGWERQSSFQAGGTYKKGERGLLVLVQPRGELLDLGLPAASPTPTDVVLMKADWQTIS
jgi:hypothetical protein